MTAQEAAEARDPVQLRGARPRAPPIEEDWAMRLPLAASPAGYWPR